MSNLKEKVINLSQIFVTYTKNISHLIHQRFCCVSITRLKIIPRKGLMESIPTNIPDLEDSCPFCLLTKATKPPIVPTIYVFKVYPGFMLQMDFTFFNVESIREFTSTFVATCYST